MTAVLKRIALLLAACLIACSGYQGPIGGDSPEHLLALYKRYHASKDIKNMMRLYQQDGVPQVIIDLEKRKLKKFFSRDLQSVEIKWLDEKASAFINQDITVQGQTVAYNLYVIGQITASSSGNRSDSILFGQHEDRYYFALQFYK